MDDCEHCTKEARAGDPQRIFADDGNSRGKLTCLVTFHRLYIFKVSCILDFVKIEYTERRVRTGLIT